MSDGALIGKLDCFIGKQLIECEAAIKEIAKLHRVKVNVIDPLFNVGSIDKDPHRLNVRIDAESKIVSYSIG